MVTPTAKKIMMAFLVAAFAVQTALVYSDEPTGPIDEEAIRGRELWHDNGCQVCHQFYGQGGFLGPDLTNAYSSVDTVRLRSLLTIGSGQMPAIGLDALRTVRRKDQHHEAIEQANESIKALTKEARKLDAKAEDIDNAVYDLKAVNPNKKSEVDTRTPDELLALIEAKGREIAAALEVLRRHRSRPADSTLSDTQTTELKALEGN